VRVGDSLGDLHTAGRTLDRHFLWSNLVSFAVPGFIQISIDEL